MAEVEKIRLDGVDYDIRDASAYKKPSAGIPASDLASAVRTSLGKADTALQSYTETDPTVPSWAKASTKPTYTASEVGALPSTTSIPSALSDLSDDSTHRVVTDTEKATWNGKYTKPSTGIPASDLAAGVIPTPEVFVAIQGYTSYDDVEAAINAGKIVLAQYHDDYYIPLVEFSQGMATFRSVVWYGSAGLSIMSTSIDEEGWYSVSTYPLELSSNKVTSLSSSSTDTQYPSAKAVYDMIGDVETLINAL